ncbi:MAG: hypothetical protein Q9171_006395 [Xanthocarpia ochracea]
MSGKLQNYLIVNLALKEMSTDQLAEADVQHQDTSLERTYLGYFRTSLALAFLGVFIAQLFRLQHTEKPHPIFGFFVLGIPLSCICTGAAIFTNLLGAYRFWRQQNAMLRGKILCGGWEVYATLVTVLVTLALLFVLVMAVSIKKG